MAAELMDHRGPNETCSLSRKPESLVTKSESTTFLAGELASDSAAAEHWRTNQI
jgi:hypothetical protein